MKKIIFTFFVVFQFASCKTESKVQLNFLDEYVIADSLKYKSTIIGGLSGVDYANGYFYFVVDDSRDPRFVKSKIKFEKDTILSIDFVDVVSLNDSTETFYKNTFLDLESIFVDEETQEVNFVSEGSIVKGESPSVFTTDTLGELVHNYNIPNYFIPNDIAKLKHNGAFEGSSKSSNNKGFWVAMESPLLTDGDEPTFNKTSSPIRITYFDKTSKKATKQFAYQLEHITKPAKAKINLNGLTAILEYKDNHFFIIERTYQSGYGAHGNIIRIFEATVENETTNTLDVDSLEETEFIPLKKRLLFNFADVENKLTDGIIDNIEGITFGPTLANGNKSLLVISDDNFQVYGRQLNQFLLLEIVEK